MVAVKVTDLFIFISLGVFVSILIARNVANVLSLTITLFALDQWAQIAHSLFVKYPFLANLIVGILIFLAFTKEFLAGKIFVKDMLRHKVMIATIALIVYSVTSSIWSPVTELALEKWIEQLPYFIVIVVMTPLLLSSHRSFEEAISNVQLFGLIMVAIFTFLVDWNMRMIVAKGGQVTIALPLALAQLGGFVFLFSLFYKKSKNIFWLMIRISAMLISMILIFKNWIKRTGYCGAYSSICVCSVIIWSEEYQSIDCCNCYYRNCIYFIIFLRILIMRYKIVDGVRVKLLLTLKAGCQWLLIY